MEGSEECGLFVSSGRGMLVYNGMGGVQREGDVLEGAELLGEVIDGCTGLTGDSVDFHFCGCGGAVRCGVGRRGCWVLRAWTGSVRHLQCGTARSVGRRRDGKCGGNMVQRGGLAQMVARTSHSHSTATARAAQPHHETPDDKHAARWTVPEGNGVSVWLGTPSPGERSGSNDNNDAVSTWWPGPCPNILSADHQPPPGSSS